MSAAFIEHAINSLGKSLTSLTGSYATPLTAKKSKIFPEDVEFSLDLIDGLELRFYEKTECLEGVFVTLKKRGPLSRLYAGALPDPYIPFMSFQWIRETFGEPYKSQGPKAMPKPLLASGGWDNYRPVEKNNVEIYISYSENREVCGLAFMLIDTGRD